MRIFITKGEIIVSTVFYTKLADGLYKVHIDCSTKYSDLDSIGSDNGQPSVSLCADKETIKLDASKAGTPTEIVIGLKGYNVIGTQYHKYGYDVFVQKDNFDKQPRVATVVERDSVNKSYKSVKR